MPRPRRRLALDTPELNLVPLLDMISLLIQMLLINVQFGVLAEVPAEPGAETTPSEAPPSEALDLVVHIEDKGYSVRWNDGGKRPKTDIPCAAEPCTAEGYDRASLRAELLRLKASHKDDTVAVVVPAKGTPYQVVLATLDELRRPEGEAETFPTVLFPPTPR